MKFIKSYKMYLLEDIETKVNKCLSETLNNQKFLHIKTKKNDSIYEKINYDIFLSRNGVLTNGYVFLDLKNMALVDNSLIKESFVSFTNESQGIISDMIDVAGSVVSKAGDLAGGVLKALKPSGTSEWIHLGVDTISMILDFIPTGFTQWASFVIDIMNGLSYFVESEFYPEEKMALCISGLFTIGFASAPALGNEAGITAKQAIKKIVKDFSKSNIKGTIKQGLKKGSKKESEIIGIKILCGVVKGIEKIPLLGPVIAWLLRTLGKGLSVLFGWITKIIAWIISKATAPLKAMLDIMGFNKLVAKFNKGAGIGASSKEAMDIICKQSDEISIGMEAGKSIDNIEKEAVGKIDDSNNAKIISKEEREEVNAKIKKYQDLGKSVKTREEFINQINTLDKEVEKLLKEGNTKEAYRINKEGNSKIYKSKLENSNLKSVFLDEEKFTNKFYEDKIYKYSDEVDNVAKVGLDKLKTLNSFDSNKVKVTNYTYGSLTNPTIENGKLVGGKFREIISCEIDGLEGEFVFYISSGTATPGVKNFGDLVYIPGFAKNLKKDGGVTDGWFIKSSESVAFSKQSQFMKGFQDFYNKNGFEGLSAKTARTESNLIPNAKKTDELTNKLVNNDKPDELVVLLNNNIVPKGFRKRKANLDNLFETAEEVDDILLSKKLIDKIQPLTQEEIKSTEEYIKDVSVVEITKKDFIRIETKIADEFYILHNDKISNPIKKADLPKYLEEQKIESINFVNYCNENLMNHKDIISILFKRYVGMNFLHWWNAILLNSNTFNKQDVLVMPYIDENNIDKLLASITKNIKRTDEQKQSIVDFCKIINDSYKFTSIVNKYTELEQDIDKYTFDSYENLTNFVKLIQTYLNNKTKAKLKVDGIIGKFTLTSLLNYFKDDNGTVRKLGIRETDKLINILQ